MYTAGNGGAMELNAADIRIIEIVDHSFSQLSDTIEFEEHVHNSHVHILLIHFHSTYGSSDDHTTRDFFKASLVQGYHS